MSLAQLTKTLQHLLSSPRPVVGLVFNPEVWIQITASQTQSAHIKLMYNWMTGEKRYFHSSPPSLSC